MPAMQRRLQDARAEIAAAGDLLYSAAMSLPGGRGGPDERERHMQQLPPSDEDLSLLFMQMPSLTLSRSFDLLECGKI